MEPRPPRIEIRPLAEGLWVVEHPLSSLGLELGRRMTVVRLTEDGLWLHSAARLVPELRAWLGERGPVRWVVSPNLPGVSRLLRRMVQDRDALRTAIDRILAWDFDRVILGHGDSIESGGKAAFESAFAWLET